MKKILPLLLVLLCTLAMAQTNTRVVRGILNDPESGAPLPGVNVLIKGTATGTVTDSYGRYTIEAPIGSTLVFSFVGFKTREMVVTREGDSTTAEQGERVFSHTIPDNPEKTLSPYFFIKSDDPTVDQMPLKSTSAIVHISGVIADVMVRQTYVNTGKNPIEAIYIFPGSTRAAVYAMTMSVGKRKLVAKIKEKARARKDYELAREQGRTASLLEQSRPNVFQMNVANILPGDTIAVDLRYTELITPVQGTYEFVYPTVVGPRYSETPDDVAHQHESWLENPYQHEGETPFYSFDFRTVLNTGIPVKRVFSPSHKIQVEYADKDRATIRLDKQETGGGNRDVILRYRLRGGEVESGLLLNPRNDENFFLLMMEPPEVPKPEQIPPREYIFIVDVSGSMHGFPIEVSKTLIRNLLSSLRPDDRFNVMVFESNNTMLFPSSVNATAENIGWATRKLENQQGGGGTELLDALHAALAVKKQEGFSRTFAVITDGYVTIEQEAFNLIRNNLGHANLFAIGIGSSVNRYLIEGLAHAGMGEPFVVTNESEAKTVGKSFTDFVEKPVLTNIKVYYEGFDTYDAEPVSIPDVFAERPIVIYGKYRGGALRGRVRITGFSGTSLWEKSINLTEASSENNDALRYLWARNKIRHIDDFAAYYDGALSPEERARQVTQLGLKYNLLTQYTSFVAIDSISRNPSGNQEQVRQPSPMPAGVSDAAVALRGYVAGVSLSTDATALSEVVVVGYSTERRTDCTGTIATVGEKNVFDTGAFPDVLIGRVSGTSASQNQGVPGNGTSVRIRGNNSVALNGTPLIIIDGVPAHNFDLPGSTAGISSASVFDQINAHDVESIQVMKGPSSTAIYGSRGANGALIVTTRKPTEPRKNLELTSSVALHRVNKLPGRQDRFAQGSPSAGINRWNGPESNEQFSWGPSLTTLRFDQSDYSFDKHGRLSSDGSGSPAIAYNPLSIFRDAVSYQNHLRFAGLKDKTKFDLSLAHGKTIGVLPGTGSDKISGRTFFRYSSGHFHIGMNNYFSHQRNESAHSGNSPSSLMYSILTTPPSFDNANGFSGKSAFRTDDSYILGDGSPRTYSPGVVDNPYWSLNRNAARSRRKTLTPSVFAGLRLRDWLEAKTILSANFSDDNLLFGLDRLSAAGPGGFFIRRIEKYSAADINTMLSASKYLFNSNLKLDADLGFIYSASERRIARIEGEEMSKSGSFDDDNVSFVRKYELDFNQRNGRVHSRVRASFKDIISADVVSVRESTSTLSRNIHSESAGLSFNFGDLNSIRNLNMFDMGRAFFSAGRIEREAPLFLDPNLFTGSLLAWSPKQSVPEWVASRSENVKPEFVSSLEGGVDMEFFSGRLGIAASWYRKMTRDGYIPFRDGELFTIRNGAQIRNQGLEVDVNVVPLRDELRWTTGFRFSRNRSKVLSLPHGTQRIALAGFEEMSSSLVAGHPYGVLVGTRFLRDEFGRKLIGADGFPLVDATMGVLGNPNPDWMLGINNVFAFRNFELGILFDVRYGGEVWNGTRNTMNYYGTGDDTEGGREVSNYIFDGVTPSGEINQVPVDFANPANGLAGNRWVRYGRAGVAEEGIEDASWIRLQNISFTYDLPGHLISPLKIRNASLGFIATNLFLVTNYSGIDPDTNLTGDTNGRGLDYFNLPNTRSYAFVMKLGF